MSLETAASIGIGLIKHRQEIGAALSGISGLGKLTGEGFSKIAQQFHLPTGITKSIAQAIEENRNPKNINSIQVLASLQYFDADHNGELSKDELSQGLQHLKDAGLSNSGNAAKLYQLGDKMLQQYDKVAQLDGNAASISYKDIGKLLNQDGKIATLSPDDWSKLNA
jgi:hypothetical protein